MTEEQITRLRTLGGGAIVAALSALAGSQAPIFDLPNERDIAALRERVAVCEHRVAALADVERALEQHDERVSRLERWFARAAPRRERER